MDIDSFWEYDDPAASEQRFHNLMADATLDEQLELKTQIARTLGLRKKFAEAHAILDEVEAQFSGAHMRPKIRFLLERGRVFNSSGDKLKARQLFEAAFENAEQADEQGLAVDAAHMIAITFMGTQEGLQWNQKAITLAQNSKDAKARALLPALLNNTAWDLFDAGRLDEALDLFLAAQNEWQQRNKKTQIRIARWSVARCLRALKRNPEAIEILISLEAEHQQENTVDGYVLEELGENFHEINDLVQAKEYYRRAVVELGKDTWFVENEAVRFARLKELAGN